MFAPLILMVVQNEKHYYLWKLRLAAVKSFTLGHTAKISHFVFERKSHLISKYYLQTYNISRGYMSRVIKALYRKLGPTENMNMWVGLWAIWRGSRSRVKQLLKC